MGLSIINNTVFAWEWERPTCFAPIKERSETSTTDGAATVGLAFCACSYIENSRDGNKLELNVSVAGNTRVGIKYQCDLVGYSWYDVRDILFTDTSSCSARVYFNSLFGVFQFYGGYESGAYDSCWVSPNGTVSFGDYPCDGSPPSTVPERNAPNGYIAVLWRNNWWYDYGKSNVTYGYVTYGLSNCLCINWNNLWCDGEYQSFQLLLELRTLQQKENDNYFQNRIWMQYKSVNNSPAIIGLEDQTGTNGQIYNYGALTDRTALNWQGLPARFICSLWFEIWDPARSDKAYVDIYEDNDPSMCFRGYHVNTRTSGDSKARYAELLYGTGMLLIDAISLATGVPIVVQGAAFMVETAVLGYNWASAVCLASNLGEANSPALIHDHDNDNYMCVNPSSPFIVDACFCTNVDWIVPLSHDQTQEIFIQASMGYHQIDQLGHELSGGCVYTDKIPIRLTPDIGNDFNHAKEITSGHYRGCLGGDPVDPYDYYKIMVTPPNTFMIIELTMPADSDFDIYVYNSNRQFYAASCTHINGNTEYVSFIAYSGYWYIKAHHHSGNGIYTLTVSLSPPGGGCPTLSTWNGTQFLEEETLNIHSEQSIDVKFFQWLKNSPASWNGIYTFKLAELGRGYNFTQSFIDNVQFFIVDEYGFWYPCFLLTTIHSRYGNAWSKLAFSDDVRTDTLKGDEIILRFFNFWPIRPNAFLFVIEGHNPLKM